MNLSSGNAPLLSAYMQRQLLQALALSTLALTVALWLTQSLRLLELSVGGGAPISFFLQLLMLSLPTLVPLIMPVAAVIAVVFVYHRLAHESELLVMRAAGFSPRQLARPALRIGLVLACIMFILGGWLSPMARGALKNVQTQVETEYSALLLREGVFNVVSNNLTVYIRERNAGGKLKGIMIHDSRNQSRPITIIAASGQLQRTATGPRLLVLNGSRQQPDGKSGNLTTLDFAQYDVDLSMFRNNEGPRWREASERSLVELLTPSDDMWDQRNQLKFYSEAHQRIAGAILVFTLVVAAVAFLLVAPFRRTGQRREILQLALFVLLIYAAFLGSISLTREHLMAGILPYLLCLLPLWWLWRRLNQHGQQP